MARTIPLFPSPPTPTFIAAGSLSVGGQELALACRWIHVMSSEERPVDRSMLIAHLRQFLVVIDPFGEIIQIDSGYPDFLGHAYPDVVGRNALDFVAATQAEEIAAHFVEGGEHLIRSEHDLFELELVDHRGDIEMMDCLATRMDLAEGRRWLLSLTPHFVRAPEQSLIDDHVAGASARQMARRFTELRSIQTKEGVWIETFLLDDHCDGVFTTIRSGRADSELVAAFAPLVDERDAVWNQPITDGHARGGTEILLPPLREVARRAGAEAVTIGVASGSSHHELCILSLGSHPKAFEGYVGRMEVRSLGLLDSALRRERNERLLRDAAERDALTGLANRATFDASLESSDHNAVLYIDIDNFKLVNDTYGHVAGDAVLIELARRMTAACRPTDLVARIGGDEFAVLLRDVDLATAREIGGRLMASVAEPMPTGIGPAAATVTAGLAFATDDLLHDADMAMLAGKRRGRNELVVTSA